MATAIKVKRLNRLLPLVAIGTVADCQSILDTTNRLLVRAGVQMMKANRYQIEGLAELIKQTGLQTKMQGGYQLGSQDLGFVVSPILNSSGRMSHACLSISLILAENTSSKLPFFHPERIVEGTAETICKELIDTNQKRKSDVKIIINQLELKAQEQHEEGSPMIWLEETNISKGIIGLIASRLVSQFCCPVIVISSKNILTPEELAILKEVLVKQ